MAQYSPLLAAFAGGQAIDAQMARLRKLGMTERQLEMNYAWSFFCATQYDSRTITWDGKKAMTPLERDTVARNAVMPMGHYDAGGNFEDVPLGLRIPTAPHHLVRVVVKRFTGLLFSAKMHPTISVPDDQPMQSWIETLCKVSRIWARFLLARDFGGGMGTVAMSFRFVNGRPRIAIHDARWCTPEFVDHETGALRKLEIRYMYPLEEKGPDGQPKLVWYWYRRIIDEQSDVEFEKAPVGEGEKAGIEPDWEEKERSDHGFGECPAVWIRNTPTDEMDGDPDCLGAWPIQEAIDRLLSQADQGAVENADPTLAVGSDDLKPEAIRKGSRNAFKFEKGGSAQYVEMSGSGVDCALKVADVHRHNFLELVQCILETEQTTGAMTATEVERRYSPMHERGDVLREQYGEHGIKPLIAKIIRATIKLASGTSGPVRMDRATGLRIVPQVMPGLAKMPPGITTFTDDQLELTWPDWVKRGPADASAASTAVAAARSAQVLDKQSAMAYIGPYFDVDDPAEALTRLEAEMGQGDADMMGQMQAAGGGGPMPSAPPAAPEPPQPRIQNETEVPDELTAPPGGEAPPEGDPGAPMAPVWVGQKREPPSAALMATLITIVERVTAKTIPHASAVALVKIALPDVEPMLAEQMIGPAATAPLPPELPKPAVPGKPPPSGGENA